MWRYSPIGELDLDAYRLVGAPGATPADLDLDDPVGADPRAVTVLVRDGIVVEVTGADQGGIEVGRLAERPDGPPEASLEWVARPPADAFDLLHAAFADPVVIEVAAGTVVEHPIVLRHELTQSGAVSFPHTIVRIGQGASATVLEHLRSADDLAALVIPVVEVEVAAGARAELISIQALGRRVWQLGRQVSAVGAKARFQSLNVALGGGYARSVIESGLVEPGAAGEILAAYFGEGHQVHDFRTRQEHAAPRTTSELLFKGALEGHAQSVYTGTIHIAPDARGCDAFQTNRNIKLSEHAWAESVPNLDIENNDVRCSHASAVGPVDPEQRFYLESRGVPPEVAERLIVQGFLDEVLDRCSVPEAMAPLRSEISAKLDRRDQDGE